MKGGIGQPGALLSSQLWSQIGIIAAGLLWHGTVDVSRLFLYEPVDSDDLMIWTCFVYNTKNSNHVLLLLHDHHWLEVRSVSSTWLSHNQVPKIRAVKGRHATFFSLYKGGTNTNDIETLDRIGPHGLSDPGENELPAVIKVTVGSRIQTSDLFGLTSLDRLSHNYQKWRSQGRMTFWKDKAAGLHELSPSTFKDNGKKFSVAINKTHRVDLGKRVNTWELV